jgi:hypothetical protein
MKTKSGGYLIGLYYFLLEVHMHGPVMMCFSAFRPLACAMTPELRTSPVPAFHWINIQSINPPNELRQELKKKKKKNTGTHCGIEFGATLARCGDPAELSSLATD